MLDVEDLLVFGASMGLLTDLIILGNLLLQTWIRRLITDTADSRLTVCLAHLCAFREVMFS